MFHFLEDFQRGLGRREKNLRHSNNVTLMVIFVLDINFCFIICTKFGRYILIFVSIWNQLQQENKKLLPQKRTRGAGTCTLAWRPWAACGKSAVKRERILSTIPNGVAVNSYEIEQEFLGQPTRGFKVGVSCVRPPHRESKNAVFVRRCQTGITKRNLKWWRGNSKQNCNCTPKMTEGNWFQINLFGK